MFTEEGKQLFQTKWWTELVFKSHTCVTFKAANYPVNSYYEVFYDHNLIVSVTFGSKNSNICKI